MIQKNKYIKNPIFQLFLLLLMTSCSSGGGGGSHTPQNVGPTKVITNPTNNTDPKIDNGIRDTNDKDGKNNNNKNEEIKANKIVRGVIPENPSFTAPVIPKIETKGESLVVGILDSDFLTHRDDLERRYKDRITILDKNEKNFTDHGEIVLGTLLEGISPEIVASSLSSKYGDQNIIKFSLEDYKKILEEMKKNDTPENKKIKIFNQSWGSTLLASDEKYIYDNKETFKSELLKAISDKSLGDLEDIKNSGREALEFYDNVVNEENGLFVWANGNLDPNDQVLYNGGIQASAPLIKKRLEKGWISAVGVDGENKNNNYSPKHLAYSGKASHWSISANGNAKGKYGSSFAAPRVSNAAIQVGEKFPWMSNNDVRLTLFTTTNKVGVGDGLEENNRFLSSTPTYTNGWGVLNKERALKGPGAFWQTLLAVDPKNLDNKDQKYYFNANIPKGSISYFENDIHGDSGLKKRGEGTLVLTGENKFTQKSKIENGTLEIYKTHGSGIDIEKNGTLILHNNSIVGYSKSEIGDEVKYSPVVNSGDLKLFGNKAFVGDYINKNGTLTIAQGSKLVVLNNANIDNLMVSLEANGYISANKENLEILEAKTISGNTSKAEIDGMRNITLTQNEDKLIASISRESAVNYLGEASLNSKETAKKIEATLKELDTKYQAGTLSKNDKELGTTILTMSSDQFKKSTEIVSGEIYASAQALNFIQAQNVNRGLSNHLASLKDFYESDYQWQGWASFQGTHGKLAKSGYASADIETNGGQFGIDKRIDNNQVGVAISFSNGEADFNRYTGRYKNDSVGISLYGKKYFEDNSYLLSRIGVTNIDMEVSRSLLAQDGSTQIGKIKHNDTMYSTYLEVGKHFKYLTPYVGYSLDILKRDGFNENSASWGIVADDKTYTQQNLIFGLQGEYKVSDTLKLTSHLTQQVNIGDRDLSFTGHFTNSSIKHTFKGIDQNQNTTWLGFGVDKEFLSNLGVSANLDIRLDEYKKADTLISTTLYYRF